MQGAVQLVQEINLSLTVMPVISHELPDDRVVLLFYMGIVILVIRTGPDNTPRLGQKGSGVRVISRGWQKRTRWPGVDLSPVVRMEGDHLPRIPAETRLKGSDDIHFCLRPYRSCLGPSRTPIRDGQGSVEVSHCLSSIMPHQVHGQGTGDIQGRHPSDAVTSSGGGSIQV